MKQMTYRTPLIYASLIISILSYAPMVSAQAWEQLPNDSKKVLNPLKLTWNDLSSAQKQSWLNRVPELKSMPKEQLSTAQSRMAEWGALSQQQRNEVQTRVKNSVESSPKIRAKLWNDFVNH